MLGRFVGLVLAVGLIALGVLLYRPDLYGPTSPQLALGIYEPYRAILGLSSGFLGAACLLAAMLRKGGGKHERAAAYAAPVAMTIEEPAFAHAEEADAEPSSPQSSFGGGSASPAPLW